MQKNIIKRDILAELIRYLDSDDIVVLHGARQVGKTYLLYALQEHLEKKGEKTCFLDLEDVRNVDALNEGVDGLLTRIEDNGFNIAEFREGKRRLFVFIDEIQYLKSPSPLLKLTVDHHKYLKLIVSGSSSFDIKNKFSDSLVGRTVEFEIFNLSFREFLRFKNQHPNLSKINFDWELMDIRKLYLEYVSYGGYPEVVLGSTVEEKEKKLRQIIGTYVQKDVRDLANIHNIAKFNNLLKLLAEQSGQLINVTAVADILKSDSETIEKYISILENTYVVKLVRPFSHSARVEVSKMPKVFFYDTGLLQILLHGHLIKEFFGHVLETNIFSELVKKYGQEEIYFWRNRSQTEIDFIIEHRGNILPIEVKKNFRNFQTRSVSSFCKKYKVKDYKVVGLEGDKRDEHCIYPWEL